MLSACWDWPSEAARWLRIPKCRGWIFQVEDAVVTKGAGELSFAARNVAHTLANHSDAPARYVLVCTPAGFERHWARIAAEAAGVEPPRWALQPIPEVTVVGPPIAAQG